jgi:hypothetical protein
VEKRGIKHLKVQVSEDTTMLKRKQNVRPQKKEKVQRRSDVKSAALAHFPFWVASF